MRNSVFLLLWLTVGCSGGSEGSERGSCYPNNTCNDALTCLSDICVLLPDAAVALDAAVVPDAAIPVGPETMTIGFTTTTRDIGPYTPKNIVAAWIEAADGTFVTTIYRHSSIRTSSLKAWNAKAPIPPLDIVSGPTRLNHNIPISAAWTIPSEVPDGDYIIRVETCEVNANTPDDNAQASFVFSKNGTAVSLSPSSPNYTNVTLVYTGR